MCYCVPAVLWLTSLDWNIWKQINCIFRLLCSTFDVLLCKALNLPVGYSAAPRPADCGYHGNAAVRVQYFCVFMFKMPNITTAAAVFVTKELLLGERIAYSCWAALWETWLHPFSHYTHDLKNVCLTFKHSPFHVSSSQNEPYKKITFLPPLCFTKKRFLKCFSWKTFFHFVWRTCKTTCFRTWKEKCGLGKKTTRTKIHSVLHMEIKSLL